DLLRSGAAGPLSPKQGEYLGYVAAATDALRALVDDVIDLASADAGALEIGVEEIDAAGALQDAARAVEARAREAGVRVDALPLEGLGRLGADPRRLRQALTLLLANAIDATPRGGAVTLAAMRRPGAIAFKVTDRGRGMTPEAAARAFERFVSAGEGGRGAGAGIGLPIVKAIAELHGGAATLDSAPGEGTTATLTLPLADETSLRRDAS
ncbi:MAG: ATP-binding protein, partial [Hyphomicrobiales bacterium]|nr:ATP-binding protein [Hyphomicrobiales bacterium]